MLLGLVIEQLAGKPYQQVMRERILTPLGLTHTYLRYREADLGTVAAWYDEGELVAGVRHQSADWAGGGYVSTAADLARFLRALADREILHEQATLNAMRAWGPTDVNGIEYGLGLYRVDYAKFGEPERGSWWGHDGYGNAFMYGMDPTSSSPARSTTRRPTGAPWSRRSRPRSSSNRRSPSQPTHRRNRNQADCVEEPSLISVDATCVGSTVPSRAATGADR